MRLILAASAGLVLATAGVAHAEVRNLAGFTRLRQLLILTIVHHCGRVVFRLLIPHEERLTRLYRRLRKKDAATASTES